MHETKYTEILKLKSMLENDHISFTFSSIFINTGDRRMD